MASRTFQGIFGDASRPSLQELGIRPLSEGDMPRLPVTYRSGADDPSIEVPQHSSLLPYRGVLSFGSEATRDRPVNRRSFITLLAARAQQPKMLRVGFLNVS
jgi:hypothetical protein